MVTYRIYKVDREGRVFGSPQIIQCDDDDAVLLEARKYIDRYAIEIWRDHKRVGLIPADD